MDGGLNLENTRVFLQKTKVDWRVVVDWGWIGSGLSDRDPTIGNASGRLGGGGTPASGGVAMVTAGARRNAPEPGLRWHKNCEDSFESTSAARES